MLNLCDILLSGCPHLPTPNLKYRLQRGWQVGGTGLGLKTWDGFLLEVGSRYHTQWCLRWKHVVLNIKLGVLIYKAHAPVLLVIFLPEVSSCIKKGRSFYSYWINMNIIWNYLNFSWTKLKYSFGDFHREWGHDAWSLYNQNSLSQLAPLVVDFCGRFFFPRGKR